MAGSPKKKLARAQFDKHEDAIFAAIASGRSMAVVARHFGNVSKAMLYTWIHAGGPERELKWNAAREFAADTIVEDVGDTIDKAIKDPSLTSAQSSLHKERAAHKRWLAGKWNKKLYGEKALVELSVESIGELHLNALLKYGLVEPEQIAPVHEPERIVEAEVLAIEPAEPLAAEDEFEADPERVPVTTTYDANEAPKIAVGDEATKLVVVEDRFVEVVESLLEELRGGRSVEPPDQSQEKEGIEHGKET